MMSLMGKAVVGTCDFQGCDVVGQRVEQAQIIIDGREWVVDLCPEHMAPLLEALKGALPKSRRSDRNKVWTIEEIEALKKEAKS